MSKIQVDANRLLSFKKNRNLLDYVWLLFIPGFFSVMIFRVQDFFYRRGRLGRFIAQILYCVNFFLTKAEFCPGCEIGAGLIVRHPYGIVIGSGVKIGENCTISHGVTLGKKSIKTKSLDEYPIIGDNVEIGTKALIFGCVVVESNSSIKARSVIY